jgi:hypothetical protein
VSVSQFSIARILLAKPCDFQLLATRCCLARGSATSAPSSSYIALPSSDFQLVFFPLPSIPLLSPPLTSKPTYNPTTTPICIAMASNQPSEANGDPQEAPDPANALNASSGVPELEDSWVPTSHQPVVPIKEEEPLQKVTEQPQKVTEQPHEVMEQPQEDTEPQVAHHCAMCTYPACVEPVDTAPDEPAHDTSVSLDLNTGRSKTPTDQHLTGTRQPSCTSGFHLPGLPWPRSLRAPVARNSRHDLRARVRGCQSVRRSPGFLYLPLSRESLSARSASY